MSDSLARLLRRARYAACTGVILALPALAQPKGEEKLPPFDVQGLEHSRVWLPWLAAFLFAVACIAIAFKNPHRGHMD